jgi:hypothetical protein
MRASVFIACLVVAATAVQAGPVQEHVPKLPNRLKTRIYHELFLLMCCSFRVTSAEINDFVDRLINEIKKYLITNNLDPMPLPDLVEGFEWEVSNFFLNNLSRFFQDKINA